MLWKFLILVFFQFPLVIFHLSPFNTVKWINYVMNWKDHEIMIPKSVAVYISVNRTSDLNT